MHIILDKEQIIKGDKNLPKFTSVSGDKEGVVPYSNIKHVFENAKKYLGTNVDIKVSNKPTKKFMVFDPNLNKYIYFGQIGFQDFTKHNDLKRQKSYLQRTANMRGDWKNNPYSANNLAREILWR